MAKTTISMLNKSPVSLVLIVFSAVTSLTLLLPSQTSAISSGFYAEATTGQVRGRLALNRNARTVSCSAVTRFSSSGSKPSSIIQLLQFEQKSGGEWHVDQYLPYDVQEAPPSVTQPNKIKNSTSAPVNINKLALEAKNKNLRLACYTGSTAAYMAIKPSLFK